MIIASNIGAGLVYEGKHVLTITERTDPDRRTSIIVECVKCGYTSEPYDVVTMLKLYGEIETVYNTVMLAEQMIHETITGINPEVHIPMRSWNSPGVEPGPMGQ